MDIQRLREVLAAMEKASETGLCICAVCPLGEETGHATCTADASYGTPCKDALEDYIRGND